MKKTIWKYDIDQRNVSVTLRQPKVVHVGCDPAGDGRWPTLWIEHVLESDEHPTDVTFAVYGTGHPIPPDAQHVGSVVMPPTSAAFGLVWHVYEIGRMEYGT